MLTLTDVESESTLTDEDEDEGACIVCVCRPKVAFCGAYVEFIAFNPEPVNDDDCPQCLASACPICGCSDGAVCQGCINAT